MAGEYIFGSPAASLGHGTHMVTVNQLSIYDKVVDLLQLACYQQLIAIVGYVVEKFETTFVLVLCLALSR